MNDIDELRRQICGLTLSNETDNHLLSKKIVNDLNDESVTNDLVEYICKLVAELAKNGKRNFLDNQRTFKYLMFVF